MRLRIWRILGEHNGSTLEIGNITVVNGRAEVCNLLLKNFTFIFTNAYLQNCCPQVAYLQDLIPSV